jgi:hypothetical protein
MAELRGGTTIGGYTALHSGLPNAYLSGNLTIGGQIFLSGDVNSIYFNKYGNILAQSTGSDTATWSISKKDGSQVFKVPLGTGDLSYAFSRLQVNDALLLRTTADGVVKTVLNTYTGDTNGFGLAVGSGGLVVVGGGESAFNYASAQTAYGTEELVLTSDSLIRVQTNWQSNDNASYKEFLFDASGNFSAPTIKEGGTALGSKYLGINAKAADSELLDGLNSSIFMRATADSNNFYGLTDPNGSTSQWIRTTSSGLIPDAVTANTSSALGTSSWQFAKIYGVTIYENGTALSSKYLGSGATAANSSKLVNMIPDTANTASTIVSRDSSGNFGANTITATLNGGISVNVTGANVKDVVYATIADNDYFRIRVGGTASNAGYAEIATADDGTEPIYVRQYTGAFSTLTRTATLLDGSGNTTFPGSVTADTVYAGNWFRSTGVSGWYSQTYGGGIYMNDSSWVRVYQDKGFSTGGDISGGRLLSNGDIIQNNGWLYTTRLVGSTGNSSIINVGPNGGAYLEVPSNADFYYHRDSTNYFALRSNEMGIYFADGGGNSNLLFQSGGTGAQVKAYYGNLTLESSNGYAVIRGTGSYVYIQCATEARVVAPSTTGTWKNLLAANLGTSSETIKDDIVEMSHSGLDVIKRSKVYNYKLKAEVADAKKKGLGKEHAKTHTGLVVERETPEEFIIGEERNAVNIYTMVSTAFKAIQELDEEIQSLRTELAELKSKK